jgi:hypothetical protein
MPSSKPTPYRILTLIASFLLIGFTGLTAWFGYTVLREDAQDLCHINGASIVFYPDTKWFGFASFILIAAAFLLANALKKSVGSVLSILLALCGIAAIIIPEIAR